MNGELEDKKNSDLEGFAASVELPEGHQLVLGELPPGTVVEVATWQGTGRPDETTNRFLLSASGPGLQRRQRRNSENTKDVAQPVAQSQISAPTDRFEDAERKTEPYLGLKTYGADLPVAKKDTKSSGSFIGSLTRAFIGTAGTVAIIVVVLALLGISAVVPTNGSKTALGPSTGSLVVYKKSSSVTLGNPTVAVTDFKDIKKIYFGPSNTFDARTLQIETIAGQELVPVNSVVGRAFLAIPLLGYVVKPFLG
jgi:hypothetical protein